MSQGGKIGAGNRRPGQSEQDLGAPDHCPGEKQGGCWPGGGCPTRGCGTGGTPGTVGTAGAGAGSGEAGDPG